MPRVVGRREPGYGFAIPVDVAMAVAAELLSAQHNTWHGIISKQPGPATVKQCVVNRIDSDSPAAKCGLQPGDVISSVGDSPVARALDLERALLGHQAGRGDRAGGRAEQEAGEREPDTGARRPSGSTMPIGFGKRWGCGSRRPPLRNSRATRSNTAAGCW